MRVIFVLFMLTVLECGGRTHAESIKIGTPLGELVGETVVSDNDIIAFKGIPYALPPIGELRWAPPKEAGKWSGVRVAKAYSPACMQQLYPLGTSGPGAGAYLQQSEDCLYLNVFISRTTLRSKEKRPVLFYIHGGGRRIGQADYMEKAAKLTHEDIVLVTMNYRLGIFSFFAHPELSAESEHLASGNYGTLDLIEALKWVRNNIESFGGDPDNVTIAGPSGGGNAAGVLLASPLAHGLFQRAAPMCSGAGVSRMLLLKDAYLDKPSAESLGQEFATNLGAPTLADLRAMPAQEIQNYVQGHTLPLGSPAGMGDIVDGWVFPKQIRELHELGARSDVPVMLGINADELTYFPFWIGAYPKSGPDYESAIAERYGVLAGEYLKVYPAANIKQSVYDAARDGWALHGVITVAKLSRHVNSKVFLYYMAHRPPDANEVVPGTGVERGVAHCTDESYFENELVSRYGGNDVRETDRELAHIMLSYFISFIKTGDPNGEGLPIWPAYDSVGSAYMRFEGGRAESSNDLLPDNWAIYEKIRQEQDKNCIFGLVYPYGAGLNGYSNPDFTGK